MEYEGRTISKNQQLFSKVKSTIQHRTCSNANQSANFQTGSYFVVIQVPKHISWFKRVRNVMSNTGKVSFNFSQSSNLRGRNLADRSL